MRWGEQTQEHATHQGDTHSQIEREKKLKSERQQHNITNKKKNDAFNRQHCLKTRGLGG